MSSDSRDLSDTVIQCVQDAAIDGSLDSEICQLLQVCFPHESKFKHRRFYNESPQMRWTIRVDERLVAHIAAHEKTYRSHSQTVRFCGISEVCILPDCRGRGYLPELLAALEGYYSNLSYDFSILLGPANIYQRYGYLSVENVFFIEQSEDCAEFAMYKALGTAEWMVDTHVLIEGPYF